LGGGELMPNLTNQQCADILDRRDIKPTPQVSREMLYEALREAFTLGLHAEVMKTKVKEPHRG